MKAAIIEAPGVIVVRDVPPPECGEYQARCTMLYGAVCAGTDLHLIDGHKPFSNWCKLPAILGHESIGRVCEVGSRVRNLRVGDLVTRVGTTPTGGINVAWGGFAEIGVATDWKAMLDDGVPEQSHPKGQWRTWQAQRSLPAVIDPAAATMIITWRETLSYLRRIGLGKGQRLLVLGSGGNGLAFAGHGKHMGAMTAMVGSVARAAEAQRLGAELVDYRSPEHVAALRALLSGQGFDVIVDAIGKAHGVDPYLPLLKPGGTVAIYGLDDIAQYRMNPMAASGSMCFYKNGYDEAEVHDDVVALMQEGRLDARVFLTNYSDPFTLSEMPRAVEAVRRRTCVKPLIRLMS